MRSHVWSGAWHLKGKPLLSYHTYLKSPERHSRGQSSWKKNTVSAQTAIFTVLYPCACPQAIIKNLLTTRYPVNHGSPPPPYSTNKCSELEGGQSFKCLLCKHEDLSLILSTFVINLAWQHTSDIPTERERWVSEVHSPDSLA